MHYIILLLLDVHVYLLIFVQVTVIGDGTGEEIVVSGQKLLDKDELLKVGAELACPKAVKDTRKSLEEKLYKLVTWLKPTMCSCAIPSV